MSLPTLDLRSEGPRLLVAHTELAFLIPAVRILGQRGWSVYVGESADEVRRLVRQLTPEVVLLATRLPDESGWLTCDKLVRENPDIRVYLMDANPSEADHQFAEFVGATGLIEEGDLDALPSRGDLEGAFQAAG